MFGKFIKKKLETVETDVKSTQKNDLFTLLEQTPEKSLKSTQSMPEITSKTTKPETPSKTTMTETPSKTTKPETPSKTTKPETPSKDTAKVEADEKTVDTLKSQTKYVPPMSSVKGDKSQLLILEIEKIHDKTIKPVVDFNENCLFYPILAKVGESPDNVSYFDELVAEGVLIKQVFEKLIICPIHPDAFSSSVRLYCPKCNSLNVDKLNLYEHKKCGYITESSAYDFSNPENSICPSFCCRNCYLVFVSRIQRAIFRRVPNVVNA